MKQSQAIQISIVMLTAFTTTITPSAPAASSGPTDQIARHGGYDREGRRHEGHRGAWAQRRQERDTMRAETSNLSGNMQHQIIEMNDAIDKQDVSTLTKEVTELGQTINTTLQSMIVADEARQANRTQRDARHAEGEASRATVEDTARQEGRGRGNRWKETRGARDALRETSWTAIAELLELQQMFAEKLNRLQAQATPEQQAQYFKEIKKLHQDLVAKHEAFTQAQQAEDQARPALHAERGGGFRRRAQEAEQARIAQAVAQAEEARLAQEAEQARIVQDRIAQALAQAEEARLAQKNYQRTQQREKEHTEPIETRSQLAKLAKLMQSQTVSHL